MHESGLNCTSSTNQQRISAVAESIGLDETVVKVLSMSERRATM